MRADTHSHVVLTGRWAETDSGRGVFIAVLPIKQGAEVFLETAATVPVESARARTGGEFVEVDEDSLAV